MPANSVIQYYYSERRLDDNTYSSNREMIIGPIGEIIGENVGNFWGIIENNRGMIVLKLGKNRW